MHKHVRRNRTNRRHTMLMIIGGITIALFCGVAIATIVVWVPTALSRTQSEQLAVLINPSTPPIIEQRYAISSPTQPWCSQCGIVESTREIPTSTQGKDAIAWHPIKEQTNAIHRYEISVRLDNGETRVIQQTERPDWRRGDHVEIINGVVHSNG